MEPEKVKHSLRRFRRRTASLHRRMIAAIQSRSQRYADANPILKRGLIRGYVRSNGVGRRLTRQELQHYADWRQSQNDIGSS